jgi:outer membrane protein assembly factor BamD (BamD/ComL family)
VQKSRFHLIHPIRLAIYLFLLAAIPGEDLFGQPGTAIDLPKPKKFENRTLASEKSTTTKMNALKRFNQNINTKYNFNFNAANELNEVVLGAKMGFKDDFSKLLPFYNYSLENTQNQKTELDSVILKCNNGILLHDLRNDWVDDLYLLMGKAYYYQKKFDSAAITFQYINYAFQPRSKDEIGFDKYIGSNQNNTGNVYTISTPEKKNIVSKAVGHSPARNDAILWLVHTFIAQGRQNEAWSLMTTLRRDVSMPDRLQAELEEMLAWWYYEEKQYDSAAVHLEEALPAAGNILEKSRWEFLAAQMYERTGSKENANRLYAKCIGHTTDPVMEAYARISQIRLVSGEDEEKRIRMNLDALMDMAKKAKYEEYRHLIYYAAAQLELSRQKPQEAMGLYKKSLANNSSDDELKNKTFLELGNLAFSQREYRLAYNCYDSLSLEEETESQTELIGNRIAILNDLLSHMENIRVEDSLQKIADMPEADRNNYLKSQVRKLRKEKGLKEEESQTSGTSSKTAGAIQSNEVVDLFAANNSKGEWYFYNSSLKAQGSKQFQSNWGNRPNLDNWRRITAVNNQINAVTIKQSGEPEAAAGLAANSKAQPTDISLEGLLANIPLTAEQRKQSDDTIQQSLYRIGKIFQDKLGDCDETILYFEKLLNRYPQTKYQEEALFGLCYCYQKSGNTEKANFYKGFLTRNFNQSKYLRYLNNPGLAKSEQQSFNKEATQKYEGIYRLFIEGKFDEALLEKKKADSTYGENYWSPQLLYIESIYYIKQKQDSLALATLNNILVLYPQSTLGPKVGNLMSVLSRRSEIEAHLDSLNITRYPEDSFVVITETAPVREKEKIAPREKEAPPAPKVETAIQPKTDTTSLKAPVTEKKSSGYSFKASDAHMVVLVLDKVDVVYVNEARMALIRYNKEKFYNQPLEVVPYPLDDNIKLVQIKTFSDAGAALSYLEKTKSVAPSEIFSWLPADKYRFIIMTEQNLEVLKEQKNMDAYLKFLKENIPGKF